MAKNEFGRLLKRVKRGETVTISARNKPVAHIVPIVDTNDVVSRLVADGLFVPPTRSSLDLKAFLKMPHPKLSGRASLAKALVKEREENG